MEKSIMIILSMIKNSRLLKFLKKKDKFKIIY